MLIIASTPTPLIISVFLFFFFFLQRECLERLEERDSLCIEEREFMLAWNLFMHKNVIHSDSDMAHACLEFARKHRGWLADLSSPFRRCFAAHLSNLWKFRLLTPAQVQQALGVATARAGGGPAAKAEKSRKRRAAD